MNSAETPSLRTRRLHVGVHHGCLLDGLCQRTVMVNGVTVALDAKGKRLCVPPRCQRFSASVEWLQRYKNHYDIVRKAILCESESAKTTAMKKWLKKEWPRTHARYQHRDIINADETGLFWQMLPWQTMDTRRAEMPWQQD
ncbi:hypothetical protein HPB51_012231 [Rhipicephalus microplus]|uniref:Uncharacterized protein n=1 Tax=Rhipicephalus microplus TaxID=6941 RepID=A0A9J6E8K3_RHIMP|nr:hypothetical protein HPB51_012231 [Rhipicephalus microplus]